jgi:plastocyanin
MSVPTQIVAGRDATVQEHATVRGMVTVVTRSSRRLASAGAYPGRTVALAGEHNPSELPNVIVSVDAPPAEVRPMTATIRQVDEEFVPHVTGITAGSTVEFPNDDLLFHNVFSLSRAATFDLGRFPRGRSKSRRFDKPGLVKVYCHLHSHMSAVIRVFDHPYFAVPDVQGRFEIEGLPPGSYTVRAWHERVGDVSTRTTLAAGATTELSFSLPLTEDEP